MLTPAYSYFRQASSRSALRLLSLEADVNFLKGLSSHLFKVAYVIRDSLSQASDGPVP